MLASHHSPVSVWSHGICVYVIKLMSTPNEYFILWNIKKRSFCGKRDVLSSGVHMIKYVVSFSFKFCTESSIPRRNVHSFLYIVNLPYHTSASCYQFYTSLFCNHRVAYAVRQNMALPLNRTRIPNWTLSGNPSWRNCVHVHLYHGVSLKKIRKSWHKFREFYYV